MPNALEIIARGLAPAVQKDLSPPDNRGGWWPVIRESFPGAWQRNVTVLSPDNAMAFHAVFACHTLICSDIAKLRVKLVQLKQDVWQETTNPAYSPVLRKPNHYQTRIQFFENWVNSKLARGNAYILKGRDGRGVVNRLYVLNPDRVQPLVSDDGQVFYRLSQDNLSELQASDVIVPQREIIHDRFNCLFHPLVGISPLYASALAATHGTNIQQAGTNLAANGIRPGGILVYPGNIPPGEAERLQERFETRYTGVEGQSKLAVLGQGAKFEALTMKAEEAQLIEQLKYTAEVICSTYHVPPYKIGIGQQPTYNNVQALNVEYYSQCLQVLIEAIEVCLDEGLNTGETLGTEFDTDNLLRMDSVTQITMLKDGVSAGVYSPNEARAFVSKPAVKGGDVPFLQQQNWPIDVLADRPPPNAKASEQIPPTDEEVEETAEERAAAGAYFLQKELKRLSELDRAA